MSETSEGEEEGERMKGGDSWVEGSVCSPQATRGWGGGSIRTDPINRKDTGQINGQTHKTNSMEGKRSNRTPGDQHLKTSEAEWEQNRVGVANGPKSGWLFLGVGREVQVPGAHLTTTTTTTTCALNLKPSTQTYFSFQQSVVFTYSIIVTFSR